MAFISQKYELIHFNKARRWWKNPVALAHPGASGNNNSSPSSSSGTSGYSGYSGSSGYSVVKLVESARFLEV
jgi:hypothetical protein